MRLAAFALLLFCISLMLYLEGFTSPMTLGFALLAGQPVSFTSILSNIMQNAFNVTLAGGWIGIAVTAALLTGFSGLTLIPALILSAIANYILLPLSFILPTNCISNSTSFCVPQQYSLILMILLNLLFYLTIAEYTSGRG